MESRGRGLDLGAWFFFFFGGGLGGWEGLGIRVQGLGFRAQRSECQLKKPEAAPLFAMMLSTEHKPLSAKLTKEPNFPAPLDLNRSKVLNKASRVL